MQWCGRGEGRAAQLDWLPEAGASRGWRVFYAVEAWQCLVHVNTRACFLPSQVAQFGGRLWLGGGFVLAENNTLEGGDSVRH